MYETIKYEVINRVAWITLNRPDKLNAFTAQMNKDLKQSIKLASRSMEVRCIVLTGEGRGFCSGQDLAGVNEDMDHGEVLRALYNPMIMEIHQCEKPVIAAVNGVAAGAGMSLALACDFRLLSERASFVEAFIHVGLVPDAGNLYYLPKLIGHAKALELAIMGEKVSAFQAEELGLANKVYPEELWRDEVASYAERLASMPTAAISLIKKNLKSSWNITLEDSLEKDAQAQRIAGLTSDHKEGVNAFIEKRKPVFQGR
ncbi:enoyl-CoA hydratase-related protein [Cytobacillus purgationiresistens]|uniref:2-(1,2-epoxy-1,2-dihydrophenyl)acetyl-CoA isomerase n=1 Tax=Cytobacillus purgationiresistens TaxID=863449 RepID=A0ABU0AGU5_9BACI|nr:enoyl-CoA hydratase-related protein [Cytobacillus purgationiresistens]MDQ0269643.1 2-(1,2-epoxy-1,2-dihydrophenyl)acetyl-CoA isomerase [Cytobacillus purgationiresistens]